MKSESYGSGSFPARVYRNQKCTVPARETDIDGWMKEKGKSVPVVKENGVWISLILASRLDEAKTNHVALAA